MKGPTPSHRTALEMICATLGTDGRPDGHRHQLALKIARAALLNHAPLLNQDDRDTLAQHLPQAHPARSRLPT